MRECADFTPWLVKLLEADGALVLPYVAGTVMSGRGPRAKLLSQQQPGWPDRHVIHRDWIGWVELKVDDNQPSPRQRAVAREINRRQPGRAVVIRGYTDLPGEGQVEEFDGLMVGPRFRHVEDLMIILRNYTHEQEANRRPDSRRGEVRGPVPPAGSPGLGILPESKDPRPPQA